jgi:hypothetical protein
MKEDRAFTEEVETLRVASAPIRGRKHWGRLPSSLSLHLCFLSLETSGGGKDRKGKRRGNGGGGWDPSDLV